MTLKPQTRITPDPQHAVTIPCVLRSRSTAARNVPVTGGLCVPKGQLLDAEIGHIDGFQSPVAAQFDVLNRWNDGSVRWMLASFIAPEVSCEGRKLNVHTASHLTAKSTLPKYNVTTVKGICGEICLVTRDLTSDPPTEKIVRLMPCLYDVDGKELPIVIGGIHEDVSGAVQQVYVVNTHVQSKPYITFQLRLTHWTSVCLLHVETRIRNSRRARHAGGLWDLGDPGSFVFGSFEIAVGSDDIPASAITHWKTERQSAVRSTSREIFLRQSGSGGSAWNSSNHVTAAGQAGVKVSGYEVNNEIEQLTGDRAEPTFLVEGDSSFLAVCVPEFWQQFPSSLAAAMGTLEVGHFPALPDTTYELQGGEQKTQSFWLKTGSGKWNADDLDWVHDAPRFVQSAVSITDANVLPWFSTAGRVSRPVQKQSTPESACEDGTGVLSCGIASRLAEYLNDATSARFSLTARRDSIDEYGWRNFGEVPADHEQTHYAGTNTVVSHYNNQFDMIFGGILQLASTGDLQWFDLLDPLARHVMDIDIYHTTEDRAAFNGGLFWHTDHYVDARSCTHRTYSKHNQKPGQPYGGGPSCEHNYTTGLLHYHFLTGSPEAREAVLSLADWVIAMDDGRNTICGLLDNGPTGAASATVFDDFHGPGRGAGNSINALLDGWILTGESRYLNTLEELIRRCVHPSQNPDDLHLLDAEGHWSYTVFLNSLGRYLLAKHDAEHFDAMYAYSRDVMQTYGRWMAANEHRTLDKPEALQYPTEAWAAQDFRKANVLRIAASCEDDANFAAAMYEKANLINDAAWNDMAAFGEARLTARCLSILLTEGNREVFHRTCEPTLIHGCQATYDAGSWTMFVPQKQRIQRLVKSPGRLMVAGVRALNPVRILATAAALRRQL